MLGEYVARLVSSSVQLRVGLALGLDEVTDAGYSRTQPASWDSDGSSLFGHALFGPFRSPTEFDTVLLFDRDELVESRPLLSPARLAPGMTHQQRVTVTFTPPETPHL